MTTSKLLQSLLAQFSQQRFVFWHDTDASFADAVAVGAGRVERTGFHLPSVIKPYVR